MQKRAPDDHPHTSFTDHWIRVPETPGTGAPVAGSKRSNPGALDPVLPAALAALSPAERAYVTGRAYLLKSLDFPDPIRAAMWRTAEESFRGALRENFHPAESWFFLGKLLTYQRRSAEAAEAYRNAVALDPAQHDAVLALGTALLDRFQLADADAQLRGMLARWPNDAGALAELARCTYRLSGPSAALPLFDRALAAEPWNATLHMNRALMLADAGRRADAAAACAEATRLDPVSARVRKTCAGM